MAARTDIHREGAFVPADYVPEFPFHLYHTVDGWPIPSWNIDLIVELRQKGAVFAPAGHDSSATNSCSICGAHFVHGEVWRHCNNGEYITIGHTCAAKFELLAEFTEWRREKAGVIAKAVKAAEHRARRVEWFGLARELLAAEPGINADLKTKHHIVEDIRGKLFRYGPMTKPQIALVRKLAAEALLPEEPKAPVPVTDKRILIEGEVISEKWHEPEYSNYPGRLVMTVKVQNGAGSWLCWGTEPSAFFDLAREHSVEVTEARWAANDARIEAMTDEEKKTELREGTTPVVANHLPTLKGATVRFNARVEASDTDESFGFFKRPTKPEIVSWPKEEEE